MDGGSFLAQICGFSLHCGLDERGAARLEEAQTAALRHFPHLTHHTCTCGRTAVAVWGHGNIADCARRTPTDVLEIVVGSPHGKPSWADVDASPPNDSDTWALPWEGRCVFWRIDPSTDGWEAWNDWVGSIPVYHAQGADWRIASTLEPVVAAVNGGGPDRLNRRGLYTLLSIGHFIGTDTLLDGVHAMESDCHGRWSDGQFTSTPLKTVVPSDARWGKSMAELGAELRDLAGQATRRCHDGARQWLVPLSGGLDSRTIAAVAVESGIAIDTWTYGEYANEAVYARQVAKALNAPWHHVKLGKDYYGRYAPLWADWFGCSLHFHGMYQMPFLRALSPDEGVLTVDGFLGGTLAGENVTLMLPALDGPGDSDGLQMFRPLHSVWTAEDLRRLLRPDYLVAPDEVASLVHSLKDPLDGAPCQKLIMLDVQHRQRRCISYQPTMNHYYHPVATPYLDRDYARFWMSVPLPVLEKRELLIHMLIQHYGRVILTIRGTFDRPRMKMTPGFLAKRMLAAALPRCLRFGPLREWRLRPVDHSVECFTRYPEQSLWPIRQAGPDLGEVLDPTVLDEAINEAVQGRYLGNTFRISAAQAVALHVLRCR